MGALGISLFNNIESPSAFWMANVHQVGINRTTLKSYVFSVTRQFINLTSLVLIDKRLLTGSCWISKPQSQNLSESKQPLLTISKHYECVSCDNLCMGNAYNLWVMHLWLYPGSLKFPSIPASFKQQTVYASDRDSVTLNIMNKLFSE